MRYVTFFALLACIATTVVHADVGDMLCPPIIAHDEQIPFVMRGQSSSVFFLKDSVVVVMKASTGELAPKSETGWYKGPDARLVQPAVKDFLANRRSSAQTKPSDASEKVIAVRVSFIGANPKARIEGTGELPGSANRLIGKQASSWTKGIPIYSAVTYHDLWPGIDLTFRRADGAAQCSIQAAAGGDAGRIRLRYDGTEPFTPGDSGAIVCKVGDSTFSDNSLTATQPNGTTEKNLKCRLLSDGHVLSVRADEPDASLPTTFSWASGILTKAFQDGWRLEPGQKVASDKVFRYLTGSMFAPAIPKAWGSSTATGGMHEDCLAAKVDASGKLSYFTILGGNGSDKGSAVAVEAGGAVYLLGETTSPDFPVTGPDPGPAHGDERWYFSAKLSSSGDGLTYSTCLGRESGHTSRPPGKDRMIAIVVDDANSVEGDRRYLRLGIPVTLAAFPEAKQEGLEEAKNAGSAVLLHVRMEALSSETEKGTIHHGMSGDEIKQQLEKWLARVPGAVGINNHMGSRGTSDPEVMKAVLQVASEHHLIFLDSKTAPTTVCTIMAESMGVPSFQQDLFLDGSGKVPNIVAHIRALADMTARTGYGIGICHAGRKESPEALAKVIPELQAQGIRFVTLVELAEAYGH